MCGIPVGKKHPKNKVLRINDLTNDCGYTLMESLLQLAALLLFAHVAIIVLMVIGKVDPTFRDTEEAEWELFSAELAQELSRSDLVTVQAGNRGIWLSLNGEVYELVYYTGMIRKQKGGRGHEPLLLSVQDATFSKEGNTLRLNVDFISGKKRERSYVIPYQ